MAPTAKMAMPSIAAAMTFSSVSIDVTDRVLLEIGLGAFNSMTMMWCATRMIPGTSRRTRPAPCGVCSTTTVWWPSLWRRGSGRHPLGKDGSITANSPEARRHAADRSKRAIDIARLLGTHYIVLWPAREGTYLREAKDPVASVGRIVEWLNMMLEYGPEIRIMGEIKPNEPMDQSYVSTVGHWLGLAQLTIDPARVGALIESAHSILAGLDPSDDMAYALYQNKLWSVHLNDQNGLKFDEDKAFGAVDLRRAFNQVWVLERHDYGRNGEFVGLDVKALRTQPKELSTKHLSNSKTIFLRLLELVRSLDVVQVEALRAAGDYKELDLLIMQHLLGG